MNESKKIYNLHTIVKYEAAVPRPTKEEYDSLSESIRLRGQQEPIVCNSQGIILDGHTRFEICNDHGIEPKYIVRDFDDEQQEYQYVIESNLNRRQLNTWQKLECYQELIKYYMDLAQEQARMRAVARNKARVTGKYVVPYAQPVGNVAQRFHKSLGIGIKQMDEALFLMKRKLTPMMLQQLRNGTLTISQAKAKIDQSEGRKVRQQKFSETWLECPHCKQVATRDKYKRVKR